MLLYHRSAALSTQTSEEFSVVFCLIHTTNIYPYKRATALTPKPKGDKTVLIRPLFTIGIRIAKEFYSRVCAILSAASPALAASIYSIVQIEQTNFAFGL